MPSLTTAAKWYPQADAVHGFDHVQRVYRLAERLALLEGADVEIVRAAALLHDAQPSQAPRQEHHYASAVMAQEVLEAEGWPAERIQAVQHCIRAHRFRDNREPPQTLEAKILFDADKLDAIGAIGAARAVAYAAQAGQPAYAEPSQHFLESGETEPGEPHSAFHEYLFKLRWLKDRLYTASARKIAEGRHRFLEEFYTRLGAESAGDL